MSVAVLMQQRDEKEKGIECRDMVRESALKAELVTAQQTILNLSSKIEDLGIVHTLVFF